jgi:hypothetical protein
MNEANKFLQLFRSTSDNNPFEAPASDQQETTNEWISGHAVYVVYRISIARSGETTIQRQDRKDHEFGHKLIDGFQTRDAAVAWAKEFHETVDAHSHSVEDHRGISFEYFDVKVLDAVSIEKHKDPRAFARFLAHDDAITNQERSLRMPGATCRTCKK